MYSTFDTFDEAWKKMFSPKNGFIWKDYMNLGREEPILSLTSEMQIISLRNLIVNLEDEERKFLSIFNVVKEFVEKKDIEKNQVIIKFDKPFEKIRDKSNSILIHKCPKCNNNYYSVDAFEKHMKICF